MFLLQLLIKRKFKCAKHYTPNTQSTSVVPAINTCATTLNGTDSPKVIHRRTNNQEDQENCLKTEIVMQTFTVNVNGTTNDQEGCRV